MFLECWSETTHIDFIRQHTIATMAKLSPIFEETNSVAKLCNVQISFFFCLEK